jgi:hypothetical protein
MSIILNPRLVSEALDRTHGDELLELLDYIELCEGEFYLERVSEWLLTHGKVRQPDADS